MTEIRGFHKSEGNFLKPMHAFKAPTHPITPTYRPASVAQWLAVSLALLGIPIALLNALPSALAETPETLSPSGSASLPQDDLQKDDLRNNAFGFQGFDQAPDAALIEVLINDGLPGLAVKLCEQRLPLHNHESDAYAQWLMLAMQSQVAEALQSRQDLSSIDGLAAIEQALESLAQRSPESPRNPWIQWKKLWCRWYIQQRILGAYLAVPSRTALRDWILVAIRQSLDEVEALEPSVRGLQSTKPARSASKDATSSRSILTNEQVLDLQGNLDLLKADLLYQRSQAYASGSDDAVAAATEMLTSLDRALSKLPGDWLHRPALTIARARAQVQLGQHTDALTSLESLWNQLALKENPTSDTLRYQRIMAAVAMSAARDGSRWDQTETWLARGGGWTASPELALEAFAVEMHRGGDDVAQKALVRKREIANRFGSYWEQRADALLIANPNLVRNGTSSSTPTSSASLEVFRIEVRQLLAAKRWTDAIEKLRQAESAAAREQATDAAFAFAMQIAAVFESNGQRSQAADAFSKAATKYPSQAQAPAAALMSAWLIRNPAASASKSDLEQRARYRDALSEVATRWPDSESAARAADWLERDCLAHDQVTRWLQFWTTRVTSTQHLEGALPRFMFGYCLLQDRWLETDTSDADAASALEALRIQLTTIVREPSASEFSKWMTGLSSDLRWIVPMKADVPSALSLAFDLSANSASVDACRERLAVWKSDPLGRLGVLWFACEVRLALAMSQKGGQPEALRALKPLVELLGDEREGEDKFPLAPAIELKLQRTLQLARIVVSGIQSGDTTEAVNSLQRIREEQKRSAWWLYRSARWTQAMGKDPSDALPMYRLLASGYPSGSEAWLEARARTVQTMRWIGDEAEANQLRDLILATYPNSDSVWRERFDPIR